jgi:hypothetical protein
VAQIAFAFSGFFGQNVAGKRFITCNLSGSGFFEAFGSTTIGFDLGHLKSPDKILLVYTQIMLPLFSSSPVRRGPLRSGND